MINRIYFLFVIFSVNFCLSQSQEIQAKVIDTIAIDADKYVGFDSYENYYYMKNNVFFKKKKNKISQYQNLLFGSISKVDIINPLRMVLFYKNQNAAVILDDQFNEIQTIAFSEIENPLLVNYIGYASNNKLWIVTEDTQQIGLFDTNTLKFQTITNNLVGVISHINSNINFIKWKDNSGNWFSCSIYGTISKLGNYDCIEDCQITENDLVINKTGSSIELFDLKSNQTFKMKIVENSFKNLYCKDQILSIFTTKVITNYKLNLP